MQITTQDHIPAFYRATARGRHRLKMAALTRETLGAMKARKKAITQGLTNGIYGCMSIPTRNSMTLHTTNFAHANEGVVYVRCPSGLIVTVEKCRFVYRVYPCDAFPMGLVIAGINMLRDILNAR